MPAVGLSWAIRDTLAIGDADGAAGHAVSGVHDVGLAVVGRPQHAGALCTDGGRPDPAQYLHHCYPLFLVSDPHLAAEVTASAVTVSGILQCTLLWWGVRELGVDLRAGPAEADAECQTHAVDRHSRRHCGRRPAGEHAGDAGAFGIGSGRAQRCSTIPTGSTSSRSVSLALPSALHLVPRLSRHFAENDHAAATKTMDDGIGLSMAFTLPAAVALLVMPYFIIDATVTRGDTSSEDAARTAEVLRQFAWGVPAFVLAKVFTPPFFARQKSKQPMQFSLVAVANHRDRRRIDAVVRAADSGTRWRNWAWHRHRPWGPGSTSFCLQERWPRRGLQDGRPPSGHGSCA